MENLVLNNQKNISNFENTIQKNFEIGKIDIKKLKIPIDNYWKSARNHVNERPSERFYKNLISGVGVISSLFSTYINAPIRIQCICYACTLSYMLMTSPVGLFSRFLSKISRFLLSCVNILFIGCLLAKQNNLWLVWIICLTISIILIFFLNDFWIKTENWRMSEEIHHALNGDDESKANKNWQAHGKRQTRTLLYSLGVTVSESDLDTIFKTIYSLGYWNSQKGIDKNEKELLIDIQNENKELTNEYNRLVNEYNETIRENSELKNLYLSVNAKKRQLEELLEKYQKAEIEESEETEIPLQLPKGVTQDKYFEICEMLDNGENKNHIKNITGVSVYYIDKIIEIRKC